LRTGILHNWAENGGGLDRDRELDRDRDRERDLDHRKRDR